MTITQVQTGLLKKVAGCQWESQSITSWAVTLLGWLVGCLKRPGAFTIGSQLLDGDCSHGRQILTTQA